MIVIQVQLNNLRLIRRLRLVEMTHVHVGLIKNISSVVVNKLANPRNIRENASFSFV